MSDEYRELIEALENMTAALEAANKDEDEEEIVPKCENCRRDQKPKGCKNRRREGALERKRQMEIASEFGKFDANLLGECKTLHKDRRESRNEKQYKKATNKIVRCKYKKADEDDVLIKGNEYRKRFDLDWNAD